MTRRTHKVMVDPHWEQSSGFHLQNFILSTVYHLAGDIIIDGRTDFRLIHTGLKGGSERGKAKQAIDFHPQIYLRVEPGERIRIRYICYSPRSRGIAQLLVDELSDCAEIHGNPLIAVDKPDFLARVPAYSVAVHLPTSVSDPNPAAPDSIILGAAIARALLKSYSLFP